VIVSNAVKDRLVERLKEAVGDLAVGKAFDWSTFVNPVITKEDQARLRRQIKEASEEIQTYGGEIVVDRSNEELPGYCVGPAIFEIPYSRALNSSSIATKELFGPVVHVIGYNTPEE